jgi:1,4-alpha-glucan branching enzyme
VEFRLRAEPGKDIFIGGSFNNWSPTTMKLEDKGTGLYTVTLHLPAGRHEYKFVVNDVWQVDPENSEKLQNGFGEMNSVITVG